MKASIRLYFLAIIMLLFCLTTNFLCAPSNKNLERFNQFLGEEKADALNLTTAAFEDFLEINYPKAKNDKERTKQFLSDLESLLIHTGKPEWHFDTKLAHKAFNYMEISVMRKEIWLHGYESYEPVFLYDNLDSIAGIENLEEIEVSDDEIIPIRFRTDSLTSKEWQEIEQKKEEERDSMLFFNVWGMYLIGLDSVVKNDPLIWKYVDAKRAAGNLSWNLLVPGFLSIIDRLDEPLIKRIIVAELYYFLLKAELED